MANITNNPHPCQKSPTVLPKILTYSRQLQVVVACRIKKTHAGRQFKAGSLSFQHGFLSETRVEAERLGQEVAE
jgi:hypothetical protein